MTFRPRWLSGAQNRAVPQPDPASDAGSSNASGVVGMRVTLTNYDRIVQIDQLDLIGMAAMSPDGRYRLVWRDGDPAGRVGGFRHEGLGRVLLIEDDRIVADVACERPNDGKVANDGRFIINDWLLGEGLKGVFRAFAPSGAPIVEQAFAANLVNNGLSQDGRMAVCQTCHAPGSTDHSRLVLFDLDAGTETGRFEPDMGSASSYAFDPDARTVALCYGDGERATYRVDGTMVDRAGWTKRRIAAGDLAVIRDILKGIDGAPDDVLAAALEAGLRRTAERAPAGWERARAYRLLGELNELLGRRDGAIAAYEAALTLDPQVGVTRRLEALVKAGDTAPPAAKTAGRYQRHCDRLGISHEVIALERSGPKSWRVDASSEWSSVEEAALDHFRRDGWDGAAAEGGLILTLIKAASFERLNPRNADTFIEALYAQNVAFDEDRFDRDQLAAAVRAATPARIERNWQIIVQTAGDTPAFYPRVHWPAVIGLFDVLGPTGLGDIAAAFARAPYDYRAGWPDLTLWRGAELRFLEVKAPGDQLHASQSGLISGVLRPLGHSIGLVEVRAASITAKEAER